MSEKEKERETEPKEKRKSESFIEGKSNRTNKMKVNMTNCSSGYKVKKEE